VSQGIEGTKRYGPHTVTVTIAISGTGFCIRPTPLPTCKCTSTILDKSEVLIGFDSLNYVDNIVHAELNYAVGHYIRVQVLVHQDIFNNVAMMETEH
jgi:hypothetical protein